MKQKGQLQNNTIFTELFIYWSRSWSRWHTHILKIPNSNVSNKLVLWMEYRKKYFVQKSKFSRQFKILYPMLLKNKVSNIHELKEWTIQGPLHRIRSGPTGSSSFAGHRLQSSQETARLWCSPKECLKSVYDIITYLYIV